MATIRLVKGPERSGRNAHLDALLVAHLDTAVLLVPTRTLARTRLEHIILNHDLPGVWGSPVQSLEDFALRIVEGEGRLVVGIDEMERRLLLEDVVTRLRKEGRLDALGDAAESSGFVNHALFVISQLKQAAVEPAQFREAVPRRKRPSWLDPIIADIYEAYQTALLDSGKFDRVGVYWQATLLGDGERPQGLGRVKTVILDGFDDFTPSEFRLIRSMAPHLDEVVFGMVSSDMPTQLDLFALPLATERRIRETFGVTDVRSFPVEAPETFVHVAAERLFERDTLPLPDGLNPDIEIVSCGDLAHEVETIGRRIKSLLLEGVSPDCIVVAYRSVREASPVLRALFGEFGIPASYSAPITLTDSSLARFLLSVFEAADGWKRDEVIETLTSPWFVLDERNPQEQLPAVAVLARAAGVVEGRENWRTRVDALAGRLQDAEGDREESLKRRLPDVNEAMRDLQARLETFSRLTDTIPSKASPSAYIESCRAIVECVAVDRALTGIAVDSVRSFEMSARASLLSILNRLGAWFEKANPADSMARSEFLALLRREMAETAIPEDAPKNAVRCADLDALRRTRYDYVFLAGVNEGECPQPPAIRAIYGEEDVADWSAAGVEMDSKRKWTEREMLLFQQSVCAAQKDLCITWRTLSANGRPMSPSPFVADICGLFPGLPLCHSAENGNGFVPELTDVASRRDLRNATFSGGDEIVESFAAEFESVVVGRDIERRRQSADHFDEFDGVLSDGEALAALLDRFGDEHVFGVRQVESYAECPFQFFLNHALRAETELAPAAELDPAVRGVLMHQALEAFHSRYRGCAIADIRQEEACAAMQEIVSDVFRGGLVRRSGAPLGVIEAERRALAYKLNRYLAIARNDEETEWKPTHFEVSFGPGRGASKEAPSKAEAFELDTEAGSVKFSGRIDRIDLSEEAARIIDYKSSVHVQAKHIRDGVALQMAVYAMALEQHLLPGTVCEQATLVAVGRKEKREAMARAKGEWDARAATTRERIAEIVQAIRGGEFPPIPYERICNVCGASRVCRHESGRIERKLEPKP